MMLMWYRQMQQANLGRCWWVDIPYRWAFITEYGHGLVLQSNKGAQCAHSCQNLVITCAVDVAATNCLCPQDSIRCNWAYCTSVKHTWHQYSYVPKPECRLSRRAPVRSASKKASRPATAPVSRPSKAKASCKRVANSCAAAPSADVEAMDIDVVATAGTASASDVVIVGSVHASGGVGGSAAAGGSQSNAIAANLSDDAQSPIINTIKKAADTSNKAVAQSLTTQGLAGAKQVKPAGWCQLSPCCPSLVLVQPWLVISSSFVQCKGGVFELNQCRSGCSVSAVSNKYTAWGIALHINIPITHQNGHHHYYRYHDKSESCAAPCR